MAFCIKSLFNEALCNAISETSPSGDVCPISGVVLEPSHTIKLECGHKFDASSIYSEVLRQKKNPPNTEVQVLRKNEVKCPLCRRVQPRLLPPHSVCPPVVGVNAPLRLCSFPNKCQYVFSRGKRAGQRCGKGSTSKHCKQHAHVLPASERKLCTHVLLRGPRKGEMCGASVSTGELCKRHTSP